MQKLSSLIKKSLKVHFPSLPFHIYADDIEPFLTAQTLVRVFYFFLLTSSIGIFSYLDLSLAPQSEVAPMWPILWIRFINFPLAIASISVFFIISSFIASLYPEKRIARILAFIGVLEYVAFYASMMRLDIDWYVWINTAFLLIFLPSGWNKIIKFPALERQKFLLVFWGCQALILLTYTMSGIGKIYTAIEQFFRGEINIFMPQAGALYIADRMLLTDSTSVLGPWIIDHYWLGWPFMVWSVYLLFFSLWVAFRPSLHRVWGIGLIFFHIASYLTMNIGFSAHIFLLAIFFIRSPFQDPDVGWQEIIYELPLFGWIAKKASIALAGKIKT